MRHTVTAEGFGVRLRPVCMEDADFIVWLRNLEHAKGCIGDTKDEAAQRAWLDHYFSREGDYYFIIETTGRQAVGAYGIYDIQDKSGESGRWVIRPDVRAAIPSLMLAFSTAFDTLMLDELRVSTVSTNQMMLSLNKKLGFRQTGIALNALMINGRPVDLVHFLFGKEEWPKVREKLIPLAKLAEAQVLKWEQAQMGSEKYGTERIQAA